MKEPIQVFEHDVLVPDAATLEALRAHHGDKGVPYYTLTRNGVKFNQFVGVLQVGGVTIEVLPKIDSLNLGEKAGTWRKLLVKMLLRTGNMPIERTEATRLAEQHGTILDIYLHLFLDALEQLQRQGLAKQYHQVTHNSTALKGRLEFAGQILKNLVHAERFYTTHSTYDTDHLLHQVLRQALALIRDISPKAQLHARCRNILLDFPECSPLRVTEETFARIRLHRKTQRYEQALLIARMVLLNFHPDNQRGQQHLLAILFDMNNLWERFILAELQAHSPADWELTGQSQHGFWEGGTEAKAIRPDLVFRHKGGRVVVMDTKWKLPEGLVPSSADLYQLFAYNRTMGAARGFLLYPNKENKPVAGHYVDAGTGRCDVLGLCLQAGGLGKDAAEWIWAHVDESLGDLPPTTRRQG